MKKIILILVVLLAVVAFIGMPYITGSVAEKETRKLIEQTNQQSSSFAYTEIVKYNRSFKSTEASFKSLLSSDGDETEVYYSCNGSHGVTSYSYRCEIDSFDEYKVFVEEYLQGKDPLSLTGSVSVFGAIHQRVNLDKIEPVKIEDGTLSSAGGFIDIETDQSLSGFKLEGDFGTSEFSDDEGSFKINSIKLNGDIDVADDGVQLGEFDFIASKFFIQAEDSVVEVEAFELDTESTGNSKSIAFEYAIKTKNVNIQSPDADIPAIKEAKINFSGEGFDRASVAQLTKIFQEMSEQGDITPQQQAVLIPAAEGLLKEGLGLSLDIDVNVDNDKMTSTTNLKLIEDATITDFSAVIFNPESILDKLAYDSSSFIPSSMLSLDASFAPIVENSPLFIQKGDGFKSELVLKKNNMSINGKKVTFDELMGSFIGF